MGWIGQETTPFFLRASHFDRIGCRGATGPGSGGSSMADRSSFRYATGMKCKSHHGRRDKFWLISLLSIATSRWKIMPCGFQMMRRIDIHPS